MAIGIDASRAFSKAPTGIGVYATEICSRLILDPPAPLLLYVNSRRPPELAPNLEGPSRWREIPMTRGWTAVRLRAELWRHPPELLFIPAYRLPGGRLPRSVVTIHGVEHLKAPSAYPGGAGRAVDSFVRDTLARASMVIAPSETTRADLVQLYGADPARVTPIPHGVAPNFRPRSPEEVATAKAAAGIGGDYLLAVGAHHPRKNIPFLIEAFAMAFPGRTDAVSLVVTNASGEVGRQLARVGAMVGLADRLKLLPHLGGERLAALYSGAIAACVPSLYEGFGLPALEAMACGAAVVANDVGGVQEVAAGAALLVSVESKEEWATALSQLASDSRLRGHLVQLGLTRAGRFSWEKSAAQHRSLLWRELRLARAGQRR